MAKEIQFTDATGQTDYVNLTNAAGQWYNTATPGFEAFNAANVADYDVAAAEFGTSGVYAADMPAVPAGVYNAVVRRRAGGTPALTDAMVGGGELQWAGSALVADADILSFTGANYGAIVATTGAVNDAAATATSFKTSLTQATGFWNDATLVFTSGPLAGQARVIDTYTQANGVVTFDEALTSAPANGNQFTVRAGHTHTQGAIADKVLGRNLAGGSDAGRTVRQALAASRNKVAFDVPAAGQFTVYAEDDSTPLWTGAYTADAAADPVTALDPA